MGYRVWNPLGVKPLSDIKFPIKVFKTYATKELFPLNKHGMNIEIFGLFHDPEEEFRRFLEIENKSLEEHQPVANCITQTLQTEPIKIIEDITLEEMRAYLDERSDKFRPRLLALIRTLHRINEAGLKSDTVAYKNTLESTITEILKDLEIGNYNGSEKIYANEQDKTAIRRMISTEKMHKGGRPNNKE